MTACLGKSCSFGLPCVSFVNVYQFVCVLLSLLVLSWVCFINFDHSFLFTLNIHLEIKRAQSNMIFL